MKIILDGSIVEVSVPSIPSTIPSRAKLIKFFTMLEIAQNKPLRMKILLASYVLPVANLLDRCIRTRHWPLGQVRPSPLIRVNVLQQPTATRTPPP
ncbi:MAG TPA: hypothetical protein QGH16_02400 [Verrucomicrobiota bacterium]|nr:hypothetical protein [Verrucomicrobiota bacterium]